MTIKSLYLFSLTGPNNFKSNYLNITIMIHYIIEWTNGAKESIYGSNYINALRLNGITPEMEHNIIDYEIV